MGFQLWISPNTGIRRKGTTFKELQGLFIDNITTKFIYEPINCCRLSDNSFEVKRTLERLDFDVMGVIDDTENVIGYVLKEELKHGRIQEVTHRIELENIISDSAPILELLNILSKKPYSFVIESNKVVGIVTRADINKPIVRIYIFGIISLFELHLNFWINQFHEEDSWSHLISEKRLNEAEKIFENRKGKNEELTLLECIQLCDKRDILQNTDDFTEQFEFSKKKFNRLLKDVETIRNELAHSQDSIISNLDWDRFVDTISNIEVFLNKSENIVEEIAKASSNN